MWVPCYGESAGPNPYRLEFRGFFQVWRLSVAVFGVGPGSFFGLSAVARLSSRCIDGIEPKLAFDRHVACRT